MTELTERPTELWPLGFRIRPSADGAGSVEVVDTVGRRRFRYGPEALARELLGGGAGEARGGHELWSQLRTVSDHRRELAPGWRHWHRRGWSPSDQYYVASRRCWPYSDAEDPDGPPTTERRPDGAAVPLDRPDPPGTSSLASLLVRRRSERSYRRRPAPRGALSGLLWYGLDGLRTKRKQPGTEDPLPGPERHGAAWDIYLCIYGVAGIEAGTYYYDLVGHRLVGVRPGDHRQAMTDVLQGMRAPATAAWTIGLVADVPRYQWHYRHEYALRNLYVEAGFIGQELVVLGTSYGLDTLVTPAQKDTPYLELHGLSRERYAPVYTLTMGLSRKGGPR